MGLIGRAEKSLNLPLPEMTFGNNSLVLTYNPNPSSSSLAPPTSTSNNQAAETNDRAAPGGEGEERWGLRFDTLDALAGVATGEGWEERVGGGVKVAMADQWGKNRSVKLPNSINTGWYSGRQTA